MKSFLLVACLLSIATSGHVIRLKSRADFDLQNGKDAIDLNNKFKSLTNGSPCTGTEPQCAGDQFAQCMDGKLVAQPCTSGLVCAAIPSPAGPGTVITCTTSADLAARIAATGATDNSDNGNNANQSGQNSGGDNNTGSGQKNDENDNTDSGEKNDGNDNTDPELENDGNDNEGSGQTNGGGGNKGSGQGDGNNGGGDPQTSRTLDPRVIAKGFENDGQDVPADGQVASLTSKNNFINFCLTVPNLPITNGKQITTGSCNPAPMGVIPSTDHMPSSKFTFPKNLGTIQANKAFTISMAIKNLETGNFVNAEENYFSAPQQLDGKGLIKGHSHVVIEKIGSLDSTEVTNPKQFAFFKGLNGKAQGGVLTTEVTNGLPEGFYRLASINTAANHQPVLVPVAQHGSLDDMVYFSVTANGKPPGAKKGGK